MRKIKKIHTRLFEKMGVENKGVFMQYMGTAYELIPSQGIKLHISASGYRDYIKLCKKLIPELIAYGATFKVVNPEHFESFTDGVQAGKFITIYPTNWDAYDFFMKHRNMFGDKSMAVPCEIPVGGRMYIRYGSMKYGYIINPLTGEKEADDRNRPFPAFVKGIKLGDFLYQCGCIQ